MFGVDPTQRSVEVSKIARVKSPDIAQAPEAIAKPKPPKPAVVKVPDIPYNATEKEAKKMLEDNGLKLGKVETKHNDEYDKGGVFYQDPLPGIQVKEGDSVGITLSSGPEKKKDDGDGGVPDPPTDDLYLTVPKMGLTDNYVTNTDDEAAMDSGAIKLTSTGFPWQPHANTYIAAHVLGYSGTGSYMQFAGLPSMTYGDEIDLKDANGTVYKYRVSEILTVTPEENWVTAPVPNKDMVTLQTCVNPPYYDQRLIVRAERVEVDKA